VGRAEIRDRLDVVISQVAGWWPSAPNNTESLYVRYDKGAVYQVRCLAREVSIERLEPCEGKLSRTVLRGGLRRVTAWAYPVRLHTSCKVWSPQSFLLRFL